jgi:hypothetical protein
LPGCRDAETGAQRYGLCAVERLRSYAAIDADVSAADVVPPILAVEGDSPIPMSSFSSQPDL